jgi:hypothetical protein
MKKITCARAQGQGRNQLPTTIKFISLLGWVRYMQLLKRDVAAGEDARLRIV